MSYKSILKLEYGDNLSFVGTKFTCLKFHLIRKIYTLYIQYGNSFPQMSYFAHQHYLLYVEKKTDYPCSAGRENFVYF